LPANQEPYETGKRIYAAKYLNLARQLGREDYGYRYLLKLEWSVGDVQPGLGCEAQWITSKYLRESEYFHNTALTLGL
jgi:hypothetical protein